VGETFNFIMGAVFSFSAGFIYKKYKSRKGALTGALVGAVLMSVLSVPLNYFIVYRAVQQGKKHVLEQRNNNAVNGSQRECSQKLWQIRNIKLDE